MHRILISLFVLIALMVNGCSQKNRDLERNIVPIVDFESLEPLLNKKNDTTYVVNFWATWCTPCVKEIPAFEKINNDFSNKKVKVILVNLDFPNQYESRLLPFIAEKQIKSQVIMLDDPNANSWINLVSPNWSGSIPATLIYNKNERQFFEKAFEYNELKTLINKML